MYKSPLFYLVWVILVVIISIKPAHRLKNSMAIHNWESKYFGVFCVQLITIAIGLIALMFFRSNFQKFVHYKLIADLLSIIYGIAAGYCAKFLCLYALAKYEMHNFGIGGRNIIQKIILDAFRSAYRLRGINK